MEVKLPQKMLFFSFNILISKGHPIYKTYYGQVEKVIKISDQEVKFQFKGEPNPELALIIWIPTSNFFKKILGEKRI